MIFQNLQGTKLLRIFIGMPTDNVSKEYCGEFHDLNAGMLMDHEIFLAFGEEFKAHELKHPALLWSSLKWSSCCLKIEKVEEVILIVLLLLIEIEDLDVTKGGRSRFSDNGKEGVMKAVDVFNRQSERSFSIYLLQKLDFTNKFLRFFYYKN